MVSCCFKKLLYVLVSCFILCSCKKENYPYKIHDFSDGMQSRLKKIEKMQSLPLTDTMPEYYLRTSASKEELVKLMDFEKPIVRVVAYKAIVDRKESDLFNLLLHHLNDTIKLEWWVFDDVQQYTTVSDLMISKVANNYTLTRQQKQILVDSVLLHHSYLEYSNWMIGDITPNAKYYDFIKQRAFITHKRCGNQLIACYALAKFRKAEDVQSLYKTFDVNKSCGYWMFKAIEVFPDKAFFPLLEEYFKNSIVKASRDGNNNGDVVYFARAVAAYKTPRALEILDYLQKNGKGFLLDYNKRNVYKAVLLHDAPLYKNLKDIIGSQIDKESLLRLKIQPLEYDDRFIW